MQQGQPAEIRFTAFKYRTTRLVEGKVFYVGADRTVDHATNQAYYVALVEADAARLRRLAKSRCRLACRQRCISRAKSERRCSIWSSQ